MKALFFFVFLIISTSIFSQVYCFKADTTSFDSIAHIISENHFNKNNTGELAVKICQIFLNKPYQKGTLDVTPEEILVVNLNGFDCVTLIETCVALAYITKANKLDFKDYCLRLRFIRYRNGAITNYTSRLNYFTDWIANNQLKGIVKDVTREIGGQPYKKEINFMSFNYANYDKLRKNPDFLDSIKAIESEINKNKHYYIPKEKLPSKINKIRNGDVIAITTNIEGLDIIHSGFAYWKGSQLCLIHASSDYKKVMVTEKPLVDYLKSIKKQTGVMVLRLL